MELTLLGTSSMVPTKDRNHSGFFLEYRGEGILFDCGEGIQRQLKIADIAAPKISVICISHWHGDHVLGLPGLLQTLGSCSYTKTLKLYGPPGTQEYMKHMMQSFAGDVTIEYEVIEVSEGIIHETDSYHIECIPLEHSVTCIGFAFVEKDRRRIQTAYIKKLGIPDGPLLGKLQRGQEVEWNGEKVDIEQATYIVEGRKLSYVADTQYCTNAVTLAQDADVLLCESTHSDEIDEKAEKYKHMTAKQAAMIANQAGAQRLILTHFSQRYKTVDDLEEEAKTVFANTTCGYDFMKVKF